MCVLHGDTDIKPPEVGPNKGLGLHHVIDVD